MGCGCKQLKGIPGMGKNRKRKQFWLVQHISHRRADQAQEFTTELYDNFDAAKDAYYELAKEEVKDLSVFDDMFDEADEDADGELIAWATLDRNYIHTFRMQALDLSSGD